MVHRELKPKAAIIFAKTTTIMELEEENKKAAAKRDNDGSE